VLVAQVILAATAYGQANIPLQLLNLNPATGVIGPISPSTPLVAGSGPNTVQQQILLRINVGIGGGGPQTYVFDTGSTSFNAALGPLRCRRRGSTR
jgi:hypothetical protein